MTKKEIEDAATEVVAPVIGTVLGVKAAGLFKLEGLANTAAELGCGVVGFLVFRGVARKAAGMAGASA